MLSSPLKKKKGGLYHITLSAVPRPSEGERFVSCCCFISIYCNVLSTIISSRMTTRDIYHQQTWIFRYNFLCFVSFLPVTVPSDSTPTHDFRNYNCCRLNASGGDLCKLAALPLCKSSANLWNSCDSSFRLTASSYLST